ncbi:hypothetical protein H8356DRAFT_1339274 [Neocallimastix lanati (nom. inval.)]|nr:hypothetical protein H8356DRAFT_1339274 [Neocallimastix sp. JGI-2020a]
MFLLLLILLPQSLIIFSATSRLSIYFKILDCITLKFSSPFYHRTNDLMERMNSNDFLYLVKFSYNNVIQESTQPLSSFWSKDLHLRLLETRKKYVNNHHMEPPKFKKNEKIWINNSLIIKNENLDDHSRSLAKYLQSYRKKPKKPPPITINNEEEYEKNIMKKYNISSSGKDNSLSEASWEL